MRSRLLLVNIIPVILSLLVCAVLSVSYCVKLSQTQLETELRTVAYILSNNDIVIDALEKNQPTEKLSEHISLVLNGDNDIDVITVADMTGKRVYHIDSARIGEYFVGGDEKRVYNGEHYSSRAVGTKGYQLRYFYPVFNISGRQIGFVMTSTLMSNVDLLIKTITRYYIGISVIIFLLSASLSVILAEQIKTSLLGYEPKQIAQMLVEREEIFDSLEEGLIAVNIRNEIVLTNKPALEMLGIRGDEAKGVRIDKLLPQIKLSDTLHRGKAMNNRNLTIGNRDILYDKLPLLSGKDVIGAVVVLRNRTDVRELAQQLTGVSHFVDALRANNHEFMNKLHVILGLLQIGEIEEAENYITAFAEQQGTVINNIVEHIENRTVAALLLGKISRGREFNIDIKLLPNSHLPRHSKFLSTDSLVTILGNLIENAIDAINEKGRTDNSTEEITILIYEDKSSILITVDDSGIGMSGDIIRKVTTEQFSTKGENRGSGLSLIRNIVEDSKGELTIESDQNEGTSIAIVIQEPRSRRK